MEIDLFQLLLHYYCLLLFLIIASFHYDCMISELVVQLFRFECQYVHIINMLKSSMFERNVKIKVICCQRDVHLILYVNLGVSCRV